MQFTKPIRDLTLGAATIGKGDLTHRVKIESEDELGELANSFNKMARDLERTTVSKDYVSNIIDSMIDTLIVVDPDAKIRTMNKATCKLLGYKEEELIGRPVETLFAAGEKIPLLGKKIPILLSCSVMKNEDGNIICIVCTARDITERKKVEETLIRSERLRALGEMAGGVAHDFNNLLAIILGNVQLLEKGLNRYKREKTKERLKIIARTAYEGGETIL